MNKPGQKALLPCEQNFKMLCHRCIRLGINIWKWFKDNMECLAQIPVQRLTVPTRFCPIGPTYARFCPIGPTYTRFCSIGPTHIRFLKVVICFQISLKEKHVLFHEYVLPSFIDVHFWYSTFFLYRKSTFFNVLTKSVANAENFPFCTIDPNESKQTLLDSF